MRNNAWLSSKRPWLSLSVALFAAAILSLPGNARAIGSTEIVNLTNTERIRNGLSPLAYNGQLASSAYAKAQHMLTYGYWAHTAPDGTSPWVFVQRSGYAYVTVGENLARDFPSDAAVMAGWMNSPSHRANILKAEYKDIGVAVAAGTMQGVPVTLVVAHYGATATMPAPKPAPSPAPKSAARPAATKPVQPVTVPAPAVQITDSPRTNIPIVKTAPPEEESSLERLLTSLARLVKPVKTDILG